MRQFCRQRPRTLRSRFSRKRPRPSLSMRISTLPARDDGRDPKATHEREGGHGIDRRADEPVQQYSGISARRHEGGWCDPTSIRCTPSGWLDLTKEPVVISVPGHQGGRYYLLPMLDMGRGCVRARPAGAPQERRRPTTGCRRPVGDPTWATTSPRSSDWRRARSASTRRLPMSGSSAAPRRTGRQDYDAVHKIRAGCMITPLSE